MRVRGRGAAIDDARDDVRDTLDTGDVGVDVSSCTLDVMAAGSMSGSSVCGVSPITSYVVGRCDVDVDMRDVASVTRRAVRMSCG